MEDTTTGFAHSGVGRLVGVVVASLMLASLLALPAAAAAPTGLGASLKLTIPGGLLSRKQTRALNFWLSELKEGATSQEKADLQVAVTELNALLKGLNLASAPASATLAAFPEAPAGCGALLAVFALLKAVVTKIAKRLGIPTGPILALINGLESAALSALGCPVPSGV